MDRIAKNVLHDRARGALSDIEAEFQALEAAAKRFDEYPPDELGRWIQDRALGGGLQAIYAQVELMLLDLVGYIDHQALTGQDLLRTASLTSTVRSHSIISAETRRLLIALIPLASISREGGAFWPESLKLAGRCVGNLRREVEAFMAVHLESRY